MEQEGKKSRLQLGRWNRPAIAGLLVIVFVAGNLLGASGKLDLRGGSGGSNGPNGSNFKSVSGLPANLDYSSVNQVYNLLRENYDGKLTQDQMLTGLKKGLAESTGDPYTEYFTAQEAKDFEGSINNTFAGIGAELGQDKDKNIIVVAPIQGFPADKAGLKAQDIIVTINGQSTSGMSVDEAASKIRGPKGTQVKLQVVRNQSQQLDFTITRDNIQVKSVDWKMLDNNIGYISISTFGDDTSGLIQQAASDMKSNGAKGIILDLRGNPGGIVNAAQAVASQWLPAGKTVLQEKRGSTVIDTTQSNGPGELASIPTVVLIDGGSASASEITAGALHDSAGAYLIGEKSFGKGVVQEPICIGANANPQGMCPGAMLKVTIASWYRPNGQNINHQGITPDQTVKPGPNDSIDGPDAQKDAAVLYLMSKQ